MVGFDSEEEFEEIRGLEQGQQEGLLGSYDREPFKQNKNPCSFEQYL